MVGASPTWSIAPKHGYTSRVYDALKKASKSNHFTVYWKDDIPEHFHYKHNRRVLPIFLMADEGWDVFKEGKKWRPKGYPVWGNHGWDNTLPSMRPLFVAKGPAFKSRYVHSRVFLNTDLFPLMLQILGLPSKQFPSDGSLDNLFPLMLQILGLPSKQFPSDGSLDSVVDLLANHRFK
ncbi:unnamed protein product [Oppiella nova]|uniref:Uncharacterized protein n=1 Tax=Oppiella nova TaxID=334625 RepID=A0A7R9QR27_9ACAR|nr:unnamed protein product [Oppiella nova]CAG2171175.1 unnamed protein product [Oppiella nova]